MKDHAFEAGPDFWFEVISWNGYPIILFVC
jgi:hypothetical protein